MQDNILSSNFCEMFGVAEYAEKLTEENRNEDLRKLEETLSKFILIKGIEDLSEKDKQKLKSEDIKDGTDLYNFFTQHIENFQEKLKEYGRKYRNTIIRN